MVAKKIIISNERTYFCEYTTKSILLSIAVWVAIRSRFVCPHKIVYSAQLVFLTEVDTSNIEMMIEKMAFISWILMHASERNDQELTLVLSPFFNKQW